MRLLVKTVIVVSLIMIAAIGIPIIVNDVRLLRFKASFHGKLLSIMANAKLHYEVIAQGSSVKLNSNGHGCTFEDVFVFIVFDSNKVAIRFEELAQKLVLDPAGRSDAPLSAELKLLKSEQVYVAIASDGPYDPRLDIRCY